MISFFILYLSPHPIAVVIGILLPGKKGAKDVAYHFVKRGDFK
jgi:hypothetical protein